MRCGQELAVADGRKTSSRSATASVGRIAVVRCKCAITFGPACERTFNQAKIAGPKENDTEGRLATFASVKPTYIYAPMQAEITLLMLKAAAAMLVCEKWVVERS